MGDVGFIGPLPELWILNNEGRPEQDFGEYRDDDLDIVISPTMRVALTRAVRNPRQGHQFGPLCTQIHPVLGVPPNPVVDVENFHLHLGIAQIWLNRNVTWNPTVTYHYAIMSAVRRYSEIVDLFPDLNLVNGVPRPNGCSPVRTAREFLKGYAGKLIHMAIMGPHQLHPLHETLQSIDGMGGPLQGVYRHIVIPLMEFFVTYLNPRAMLSVVGLSRVNIKSFRDYWKKKLRDYGMWSNEWVTWRMNAGPLFPGQNQILSGLMYEYALHFARVFPHVFEHARQDRLFCLDWQLDDYVLRDNRRYAIYEDRFPTQPRAQNVL
jgi:hypothetical protein